MTDIELLQILESPRTNLEKAIAIRAALNAAAPSALNIKPQVPRKPKQARKPLRATAISGSEPLDFEEEASSSAEAALARAAFTNGAGKPQ